MLSGLLCLLLLSVLSACGGTQASLAVPGSASVESQTVTSGHFHEYALPQDNSGLMHPIIDAQGQIWFGEMGRNYLASFNPQSGKFWQQTPPDGQSGIMGMVVAPDNTLWFAEQYANYIGHFSPATGQYHLYHLPMVQQSDPGSTTQTQLLPSAPNELVLDRQGYLWFSELNANEIGRLNTADGSLRQYPLPLPPRSSTRTLNPYGITLDPQGRIWFTAASIHELGRLDPASGQVSYFSPPDVTTPLMEVASDAQGQIWATTFASGLLLHFDPRTSRFTVYHAPAPANSDAGALYGLAITGKGEIWITITSENLLARFDASRQRFFVYPIPTRESQPLGLVGDKNQSIWFTEAASNKLGVLQP